MDQPPVLWVLFFFFFLFYCVDSTSDKSSRPRKEHPKGRSQARPSCPRTYGSSSHPCHPGSPAARRSASSWGCTCAAAGTRTRTCCSGPAAPGRWPSHWDLRAGEVRRAPTATSRRDRKPSPGPNSTRWQCLPIQQVDGSRWGAQTCDANRWGARQGCHRAFGTKRVRKRRAYGMWGRRPRRSRRCSPCTRRRPSCSRCRRRCCSGSGWAGTSAGRLR